MLDTTTATARVQLNRVGTGVLAVLAVAGNYLSLPLFFGVDFIFGSIAVMLAVLLFGTVSAVIVAIVGGLYTLVLWGHPYALIIFSVEALVVGLLYRRGWRQLLLADLLYWLVVGMPLVGLFYVGLLGMNAESTGLIALKQMLNACFNTLIAGLLLLLGKLVSKKVAAITGHVELSALLFQTVLLVTLIAGTVPIVYESYNQQFVQEGFVKQRLNERANQLVQRLLADEAVQRQSAELALQPDQKASNEGGLTAEQLERHLAAVHGDGALSLAIVNHRGDVIAYKGSVNSRLAEGQFKQAAHDLDIWLPISDTSAMHRWRQGVYRYRLAVEGSNQLAFVQVFLPAEPIVSTLQSQRLQLLILLTLIFLLAVALSFGLSRMISRPLQQLELASRQLASRVATGKHSGLTGANIQEYERLADTLEQMSVELSLRFKEIKQAETDLTVQVQARTLELKHAALRLQNILNTIMDGIIAINERGIIESVNPAAVELFGYRAEEMVGQNISMLMPSPHRDAHDGYMQRYQNGGVAQIIGVGRQLQGKRKDGHVFDMELQITEMFEYGVRHYVGSVRDITERLAIDLQKSQFVSTVSHELRTPLTAVCGALDLLASGKFGYLSPAAEKLIVLARDNSQRLKFLINDLLDLEKLAQGKLEFELQQQPLQPLLLQAVDSIQTYCIERHIRIELGAFSPDVMVSVDAQRLAQVLANLLSNAIKFSPDSSLITLTVQTTVEKIRVTVSDQGMGISEAFKAKIFERFCQADSSDNRSVGGTGLGLAICRELIERMNGGIGFESVEGQGADFWFELPLMVS